jgi:hypothetical protein
MFASRFRTAAPRAARSFSAARALAEEKTLGQSLKETAEGLAKKVSKARRASSAVYPTPPSLFTSHSHTAPSRARSFRTRARSGPSSKRAATSPSWARRSAGP